MLASHIRMPPEFEAEAALRLFAHASEAVHRRGFQRPMPGGAGRLSATLDVCTLR
jgi:hypothetical protein